MKTKSFFIFVFALSLLFNTFSANAYDFKVDGLCYNVLSDGNSVEVTYEWNPSYYDPAYSAGGSLVIPESVSYGGKTYSVTAVGYQAFRNCSRFTSLTIPNSVTTISDLAFEYCSGFTGTLTIPNSVTSIGNGAFKKCSGITDITIPQGLVDILDPFSGTGWYNNQPDGLVYLGHLAYKYKGTVPDGTTLTLRDGIKGIAGRAFSGCSGFTGSLTIPNSVTFIGYGAFENCSGFTSLTIPNSVTAIGGCAFYGCSGFTSLTIPNSVTTIGSSAFSGCSGFTGILTIPNSVTTIGEAAFGGCSGFTSLTIPNSVTTISDFAFIRCSGFTGILTIPNSVTTIGVGAFSGCSGFTGSLTIPNSVTFIDQRAFEYCSGFTGTLTIPNSVTTIDYDAFRNCSGFTGSLTIPNSVTTIRECAFYGCSGFTSLTIPNSVTSIGDRAFYKTGWFRTLNIVGEGETVVSGEDLSYLSLSSVYIQSGITGIGNLNLNPSSLVYSFAANPPVCSENTFKSYNATLHVPQKSMAAYNDASYWNNFSNIVADAVEPQELILDADSMTVKIGETIALDVFLLPENCQLPIQISSLNPGVVSVRESSGQYQLQGLKVGETDIIVNCAWLEARCHVTVSEAEITVTLDKHELEMRAGTIETLTPTSSPVAVEFAAESSDRSVATVSVRNGQVRVVAAKPGTATITVGSADGTATPDTCVVTVIRPFGDVDGDGYADVTDVSIMIDMVLGKQEPNLTHADLDGNGIVDVADVSTLIDIILGKYVRTETFTVNGVSFTMVGVEGGTFTMGATSEQGSDAEDREKPAHQVTLSSYSIGETEVTQELWQAVMGSNPSYCSSNNGYETNLQRPVEQVSWNDCQEFIAKLNQLTGKNFRLPTEAEWEFAARGGNKSKGYKYAGSNNVDDVAWYWDNSSSTSRPVATKSPNELGLYDMSGNVDEWCQDWYGSYSSSAQTNPTGPSSGSYRVFRGGCWSNFAGYCRVSDRDGFTPGNCGNLGLRLAL